jgi:hypothetical protein
MAEIIVVERDYLGRPSGTEMYSEGDPKPDWLEERLPGRETQAQDEREETKAVHQGSGWYLLPNGDTVRGKQAVRDQGFEIE